MTRLSIVLVLAVLLSACGSPSNVDAPVELKSFKKLYRVNVDWQRNVGPMESPGGRMRAAADNTNGQPKWDVTRYLS